MITTRRVIMTPTWATILLMQNTQNRNLNKKRVHNYKTLIENGKWLENGSTISICSDGTLADGQHRLAAIAAAKISVPVILVEGVEPNARIIIDCGMKRSFAHYLQIKKISNASQVAAVTRLLWIWDSEDVKTTSSFSRTPDHVALGETYEKNAWTIQNAIKKTQKANHFTGAPSMMACLYIVFSRISKEDAEFFAEQLGNYQFSEITSIRVLARVLQERRKKGSGDFTGATGQYMVAGIIIKGWNAFREGRKVEMLRFSPGGKARDKFPVPR